MSAETKRLSWRELIPVHPAADVFPMLPEEELRKLAEDIKKNGLRELPVLWRRPPGTTLELIDGRNRLAAMELAGIELFQKSGKFKYDLFDLCGGDEDPVAFIISKNIRRRHLTKEQQAALIVTVMEAGKANSTDTAKLAESVKRNSNGRLNGRAKDPVREKIIGAGKKHDISPRTMERAIAKQRAANTGSPTRTPAPAPAASAASSRVKETLDERIKSAGSAARTRELETKIKKAVGYVCREAERIGRSIETGSRKRFTDELSRALGNNSDLFAEINRVRAEIARRRKEQKHAQVMRNWNPEWIIKKELMDIIDFVEKELDRITGTSPRA
ncbi:MAG TPA: ParB/Srx family N-terminal domain-containing protein [Candidatus Binatia bacterium]|jgi:ParB-like chromosome segregation protein Spo0J